MAEAPAFASLGQKREDLPTRPLSPPGLPPRLTDNLQSTNRLLLDSSNGAGEAGRAPLQRSGRSTAAQAADAAHYGVSNLRQDIRRLLASRPGQTSGRYLGNPANVALWTPYRLDSLLSGLRNAQRLFYPQVGFTDFAHFVLSIIGEESTGDFRLNVRPVDLSDWTGQGAIQVTAGSVLLDYQRFGQAIRSSSHRTLLRPEAVESFNLNDPRTGVLMWSWYSRNTMICGVSLNECVHREEWNVVGVGDVRPDLGNAALTWRTGPRVDRHQANFNLGGQTDYLEDYLRRLRDYFVQSGFGSAEKFADLLDTPTGRNKRLVRTTEAVA